MANGWEWDAAVERVRRAKGLPLGSREAEEAAEQTVDRRDLPGLVGSDGSSVGSAVKLYEDIVEDWDAMAAVSTTVASLTVWHYVYGIRTSHRC